MTDKTGPVTIAPRPWKVHGVFVSDCEQTLANMTIVRDAKGNFVGAFDRVADAVVCADSVSVANNPPPRPPHLDPRELGTVLAALRYWQRNHMVIEADDLHDIANDGGTTEPLTDDEIDALCERLNTSPDPLSIPSAADLRKSRLADAGEDMLAALECAEEFLSNDPRNDPGDGTLGVIRDAIAKAKGEEIA